MTHWCLFYTIRRGFANDMMSGCRLAPIVVAAAGCVHVTSMHHSAVTELDAAPPFSLAAQDRQGGRAGRPADRARCSYRGYW